MSASQLPTVRRGVPEESRDARRQREGPLVLDRYRLHRRLGAGGFGTVWMARDERLERDVAVKILPRERVVGGRFEREARAAARLSHPGIVTLYEAAVDDEDAYLVSELVRGSTLADLLSAGRLSDRDVLAIGIALCDALEYAHSEGIVHRDVKPANILVPEAPATSAQSAKLTDFGVARLVGGDSLTRTGEVIGTAAYMAPEQAEGRDTGAPADVYALALVIYESLTGVNPVARGTAATRARRLGAHLPPLRRQRRDLPVELGQGIDTALRPRARERGTLKELRHALVCALAWVRDEPGVVVGRWRTTPSRAESRQENATGDFVVGLEADAPLERRGGLGSRPPAWPTRALASAAAATVTAWMLLHTLAPAPIAPAVAALLAATAVLVLPRLGWLTTVAAIAGTAILQQRPGVALVLLVATAIPIALLPMTGSNWALGAGAPALGAAGLAGAWPALAARATTVWRRSALGFTGWVWVLLVGPLANVDLYLRRPPRLPPESVWSASLHGTLDHVLGPLVSSGVLAPAPIWALGAVILPWLVRGRSVRTDLIGAVVWATALVASSITVLAWAPYAHTGSVPRTAVIGALASAAVALMPTLARAWRARGHSPVFRAGLA